MKLLFTLIATLAGASALAQMTPVGTWRSIDDKTGEAKAEIVIADNGGVLTGKISKLLRKEAKQDGVCDECKDDRKNKPMLGLEILRGVTKANGDLWAGGKILDAETGSAYNVQLMPAEGGAKLNVRGNVLFISRTQVWQRVQ